MTRIILMAAIAIGSIGCSNFIPFTKAEYHTYKANLKDLQYYNSEELVLRRELSSEEKQVSPGHVIKIVRGVRVEEVVLAKKTPGILIRDTAGEKIGKKKHKSVEQPSKQATDSETPTSGYSLMISFEPPVNGEERALPFAPNNESSYFYLDSISDIHYEGKMYKIAEGKNTYLLVNLDQVSKYKKERRVMPGRTLD